MEFGYSKILIILPEIIRTLHVNDCRDMAYQIAEYISSLRDSVADGYMVVTNILSLTGQVCDKI